MSNWQPLTTNLPITNYQLPTTKMAIFRQYIAPLLVVLVFLIALVAVSARIFIPADMAAPAPTEEINPQPDNAQVHSAGAIAIVSDAIAPHLV